MSTLCILTGHGQRLDHRLVSKMGKLRPREGKIKLTQKAVLGPQTLRLNVILSQGEVEARVLLLALIGYSLCPALLLLMCDLQSVSRQL